MKKMAQSVAALLLFIAFSLPVSAKTVVKAQETADVPSAWPLLIMVMVIALLAAATVIAYVAYRRYRKHRQRRRGEKLLAEKESGLVTDVFVPVPPKDQPPIDSEWLQKDSDGALPQVLVAPPKKGHAKRR